MCGGGGEHRWEVDDGLDNYNRCVDCSVWCIECEHEVEAVDEFGHCLENCSYAAECVECGCMTPGWEYDTGLDELGRCVECSVDCAICNEAVHSIDDLDDQFHCKSCAELINEKRTVSVKLGSRTIEAAVTLGDTVGSVTERIKEARGRMTRQAESMELYYDGLRLGQEGCILAETAIMWRHGAANIPSVIELTFESAKKQTLPQTIYRPPMIDRIRHDIRDRVVYDPNQNVVNLVD